MAQGLAAAYVRAGKPDKGLKALEKLTQRAPERLVAWQALVRDVMSSNWNEKALQCSPTFAMSHHVNNFIGNGAGHQSSGPSEQNPFPNHGFLKVHTIDAYCVLLACFVPWQDLCLP